MDSLRIADEWRDVESKLALEQQLLKDIEAAIRRIELSLAERVSARDEVNKRINALVYHRTELVNRWADARRRELA